MSWSQNMNKLKCVQPTKVDVFNHELDRVLQGGEVLGNNTPRDDERALKLAQYMAGIDFSDSSTIQRSLRRTLSERFIQYPRRNSFANRVRYFHEGRALAGISTVVLLVFVILYGLFPPHHVTATPIYDMLTTSAALPMQSAISLTSSASHSQEIYPRPVPTPIAMPTDTTLSSTMPESTPVQAGLSLGTQFPIITTTTSK
jgi:hypothetical protein